MAPFELRILRDVAIVLITTVVIPLFTVMAVFVGLLYLPLPVSLPKPRQGIESQISRVYDANGEEIGVFRRFETTKPVAREDIPRVLKDAVVAAEDRRFYEHGGVDPRATLRALWNNLTSDGRVQGGSTITQQYIKRTYVGSERTFSRKVREAILASRLERQVDKEEVLYRYLQQIYLGEGAYGVGAAAETYFHKSVKDLTLSESALLAGLIPAPSRYEPRGAPGEADRRRVQVLDIMLDEGRISPEEHREAEAQRVSLVTDDGPTTSRPVTAVYPRESSQDSPYPYFMDYVGRYVAERLGEEAVFEQGLKIYTTIDPRLQTEADRAVGETLGGTSPPLEMSLVTVEPETGFVKALVGGRDFEASQVNLALGLGGGGTGRQPGSSFKPYVLATALEQGVSPERTYSGRSPVSIGGQAFVNYGGSGYGTVDLRTATVKSINTVFVQLMNDVGVEETMDIAKAMGISTADYRAGFHGLSVALGAQEVSPLDMASAYGVFAARGQRFEATPVVRVLDRDGEVVIDNLDRQPTRVLKQSTADMVNDILRKDFDPGSTAAGKGLDRPAAGKTGTSQDLADAWFVGYTPDLSTSVWMGRSSGQIPLRNIKGVANVTGGSLPALTWQSYMQAAVVGTPVRDFSSPASIVPDERLAELRAQRDSRLDVGRRAQEQEESPTSVPLEPVPTMPPPQCGPGPYGPPECRDRAPGANVVPGADRGQVVRVLRSDPNPFVTSNQGRIVVIEPSTTTTTGPG